MLKEERIANIKEILDTSHSVNKIVVNPKVVEKIVQEVENVVKETVEKVDS